MNWQGKIYESLITEKRSKASRKRTSLRKSSAELEKRRASGKSLGAYGAGTRARTAKAQAKKASKPSAWYARRHYEDEAARLIAHGKQYKANQKAAKVAEAKCATAHSIDVYDRKMGGTAKTAAVGAGETRRAKAAIKASDEAKKRRARRLKAVKAQNEGTGYRRRWLGQASRDDDITATEAGTIDAAMYAKAQGDKKGSKKLSKKVAKKIAKRREEEKNVSENIYDLKKGTMKPKVKRGDPFAHLSKELQMKILAGKALRGGGAKQLAKNIDRSGGPKK